MKKMIGNYLAAGRGAELWYVYLSFCLSVRTHIS